ncbi:MAG: 6-carboxytetrahydropterin synthase [Planctomycetes bacterium]|nr:6-carboxytetrahydropterin synthase [Planctomycetota bacterium]
MHLLREVRFFLPGSATGPAEVSSPGPVLNSWAGGLAGQGLRPYLVLQAKVCGTVNPRTGYLCNISLIDRLLRDRAIPYLQRYWAGQVDPPPSPAAAVAGLWPRLLDRFPAPAMPVSLTLRISPFLSFTAESGILPMIVMTESFEFSAAHRLHCPDLTDEQNRATFGKCANAHGHGHNYVVEVSIAGQPDERTGTITDQAGFQRVVKERVIDRFDHRHLNRDCPEFAELNPSVENITRVIWNLLAGALAPARLHCVRVWETPKTCAEYRGQQDPEAPPAGSN